ncbi:MAG: sulfatase-like hydrolase/transferase [Gemmatimonadetes bacterium]|nr:sulfatase-like hydrolase/transferase [Gemmatimonadota bacterium]
MTRTDHPPVIVLCIDALRADAVGPNYGPAWDGFEPPRTPFLSAFLDRCALTGRAVASSSWTKPSVPSLFLSRYPSEHGVLEVAKGDHVSSPHLPPGHPTIAEHFRDGGYRAHGVAHNAQLSPTLGFGRGFETFDANAGDGEAIINQLDDLQPFDGPEPVFLYIHLIEPHWPFSSKIRARIRERGGRYDFGNFSATDWKQLKAGLKRGTVELTAEEKRSLFDAYRAAVEEADTIVGMLVGWLESCKAWRDSVMLVTADHGEELLDHGLVGHGQSVSEELIRVPFGLRVPEGGDTARRSLALPRHVDIFPTLAAAAGLDVPEGLRGVNLLAAPAPTEAFAEVKHKRRYHQAIVTERWKLTRSFVFDKRTAPGEDYNNLGELFAERSHRCERRLFDLTKDPGEQRDLVTEAPGTAMELEERLTRWWESLVRRTPSPDDDQDMDEALIRRLEALGYL